ncbi:hypothetical protein D3C72_636150 [compost metagenome]
MQAEVFRLGCASGAAMGEGGGQGEGPDRNSQQAQQRPQRGGDVRAQHHLLVLQPQIVSEGQDGAPHLGESRAVQQGQGAVGKGDGRPGIDCRGRETDIHVAGQRDQQGRDPGRGRHQGEQAAQQHQQAAFHAPAAPAAQPGDPDRAPKGEDQNIGGQLARQRRRQPSVHPTRPVLQRAAAQFSAHPHDGGAGHQQMQDAGHDQPAEKELETELRIAQDRHLNGGGLQPRGGDAQRPRSLQDQGGCGVGQGRGLGRGGQRADSLEGAVEIDDHRVRLAKGVLLGAARDVGEAVDPARPHQGPGGLQIGGLGHHAHAGTGLHVADGGAAEGGMVLINHGDRHVAHHALKQHGPDHGHQHDRHDDQQDQVPAAAGQMRDLGAQGATEDAAGRRRHRAGQSNRTLMPGRRPSTGATGLAWISKLRTS